MQVIIVSILFNNHKYIKINEHDEIGQRIDNFLITKLKNLPKSLIYKWIRKGKLLINDKKIKPFYKIKIHDSISLPYFFLKNNNKNTYSQNIDLNLIESMILYENNDYMIINKLSGIAVHGGTGIKWSLIEGLRKLRPNVKKMELVHRLDKCTSGCLIIAKKYNILTFFHQQLKEHKIKKTYHALVHGNWPKNINKIQDSISGKYAITHINILKKMKNYTLLEVFPITGRMHQIRIHLSLYNHPIVGDKKYSIKDFCDANKIERILLHSFKIKFNEPNNLNCFITFKANYDSSFKQFLSTVEDIF